MTLRISIFISILVCFILIISTGIYFYQSRKIIEKELFVQSTSYIENSKENIEDFLKHIKDITYIIYKNPEIAAYLNTFSIDKKGRLENIFLDFSLNSDIIQAVRVLDSKGNIKVFVKERKIISNSNDYKELNLKHRDFIKKATQQKEGSPVLSNFERGKLPDTSDFCPAMIRVVVPYFEHGEILGYLVVNFWGMRMGDILKKYINDGMIPFLVEINHDNEQRNGIFLFHPNEEYEFANQFGKQITVLSVYGKRLYEYMLNNETGMLKMENSNNNYVSFTTVYPYHNKRQIWKVGAILNGDYYFKSVYALRNNFLSIMLFGIFLSIITSAYLTGKLMSPLKDITSAIMRIGEGDFEYRISGKYDRELMVIAEKVNKMAESIRKYITEIEDYHTRLEILNRLSAIGFLSAGIAHELNTPLNSIIILCDLISEDVGEETKKDLLTIKEEARNCVMIINNLKALIPENLSDKKSLESCEVGSDRVNIKNVIENAVKFMNVGGDISLKTELEDVEIYGNKNLLQIAILNLIMNAVEATYPSGIVYIKVYEKGEKVIVEVSDNGKGMDKDTMKNIFNPFFTTKRDGLGMGLALVHKIVTIHGGTISFESEKGKGSKFLLEFNKDGENTNSRG